MAKQGAKKAVVLNDSQEYISTTNAGAYGTGIKVVVSFLGLSFEDLVPMAVDALDRKIQEDCRADLQSTWESRKNDRTKAGEIRYNAKDLWLGLVRQAGKSVDYNTMTAAQLAIELQKIQAIQAAKQALGK